MPDEPLEPPDGWTYMLPGFQVMDFIIYEGKLWAAGRDGVKLVDPVNGEEVAVPEDREFPFTAALEIDHDGNLWIGHDEGVTIFNGDNFIELRESDGLISNHVRSLASDGEGMWIGTTYGATYFNNDELTNYTPENGLLNENVNAIIVDSAGGVWFGSYRAPLGGVSFFENGKWSYYSTDNGLPHNNITAFAEEVEGGIWTGTGLVERGGAVKISRTVDDFEISPPLDKTSGLAANKVRSIFIDHNGARWFGSEYNGVTIFHNGGQVILDSTNGLSNNEVTSISKDSTGSLLIGTFSGITLISASALGLIYSEFEGNAAE